MSDENEHEPQHPHGFAFHIGPTPEQLEQIRMEGEANGHETREFFDSLTEDQLKKLSGLFHQAHTSEGHAALYYIGVISGFLDQKFNTCLACGKKHDEELANMTGQPVVNDPPQVRPNGSRECCNTPSGGPHHDLCPYMMEYNLEPDDDGSEKAMCKNCKQWYANLEDRMLRPAGPAGCEGCRHKTKWG